MHDGEFDWSYHMFSVNQFYHCRGEVYDYEENVYFGPETARSYKVGGRTARRRRKKEIWAGCEHESCN